MIFDTNIANTLTLTLTNLNITLASRIKENKTVNYLTFNKRDKKDIDDFIIELEKVFAVNQVSDNRKYIVTASCLKGTAANFYDRLAGIMRWNVIGQAANTQLKLALET